MTKSLISKTEILARTMCIIVGFSPVDPMDGTPNWWLFHNEAEKIVKDLLHRFAVPNHYEFGPEYGTYDE